MIFEFDAATLNILKTFSSINPNIYIRAGNFIDTVSATYTIYAYANLNVSFPYSFGIYDLSQFLTCLSMFNRPQLDFGNKCVKIYEFDNPDRSISYMYTEPNCIIYPPEENMFDKQKILTSFDIKYDTIKDAIKAASILDLKHVAFVGDEESIYIKALDSDKSGTNFSEKVGTTDQTFNAIIKLDNLKMMKTNYRVDLAKQFAKFSLQDGDIVFYIVLESTSEIK